MRYLRSLVLASITLVTISQTIWAAESIGYKAGRLAVYAEYCGRFDLNNQLYKKFNSHEDFIAGNTSISMFYDYEDLREYINPATDCADVRATIKQLLQKTWPLDQSASSYAIVKRTQEALRSLGLYSGKIDGVVGVQVRSGLKQWQKRNGFADTGKIEEAQLVKLERDALAAIAKREEERKEIARLKKQQQAQPKKIAKKPAKKSPPPKSAGTGSGFFVSKLGHIVTNEHVVRNCGSITVGDSTTNQVGATLLEKDKRNDLALLRISSTQMASAESKSLISKLGLRVEISTPSVPLASGGLLRPDDVELGEDLLVSGYPYGEIISNTIKVTKGIVSANKGMGDDSSQFQMDAAVQAGNSGGPIYDENGNIVGVVVQQLNKLKVAKVMGSLPENVNFAIKASTVRQFLTAAGLPTKWSNRSKRRSTKDLAKIAKNQTVMVVCNP